MGISVSPIGKGSANVADFPGMGGVFFDASSADDFAAEEQSAVNCPLGVCPLPCCLIEDTLSAQVQMLTEKVIIVDRQPADRLARDNTLRKISGEIQDLHPSIPHKARFLPLILPQNHGQTVSAGEIREKDLRDTFFCLAGHRKSRLARRVSARFHPSQRKKRKIYIYAISTAKTHCAIGKDMV